MRTKEKIELSRGQTPLVQVEVAIYVAGTTVEVRCLGTLPKILYLVLKS